MSDFREPLVFVRCSADWAEEDDRRTCDLFEADDEGRCKFLRCDILNLSLQENHNVYRFCVWPEGASELDTAPC